MNRRLCGMLRPGNLRSSFLEILLLIVLFSCGERDSKEFSRKIDLEGEINFRDLGNYRTDENDYIRPGLLYRSGSLHKLTASDTGILRELGIKTVVSFLTPAEVEDHGPDILPAGVNTFSLPIEGLGDEVNDLILARKTGDFSKIPSDFNYGIHKILPETGMGSYTSLFKILADPENYPVIFHCSHGVHRTGTAAALVLSSMGVEWNTIREDYMLSNEYRFEGSSKRVDQLVSIAAENEAVINKELNRESIEAFYFLRPEYVDGTRSHILDKYGSFEGYYQAAGISDEQIEKIREILLED